MKIFKNILNWSMALVLASTAVSCNKWLNVTPYDKISEGDLLSTDAGFRKLLNGIYIELNSENLYGGALSVEMIEIMGGAYEIQDNSAWSNYKDIYDHEYGTEYWRSRFSQTWDAAYALILNCNKFLEKIPEKKHLFSDLEYNILRGEAMALRAMLHFDMLRLFGPVYSTHKANPAIPYYTKYVTVPEPILTAEEIAAKVITDLKDAQLLLTEDPVRTHGTMMDSAPADIPEYLQHRALRMNYFAVSALLARAGLYTMDKELARENANTVIGAVNDGIFPFVDRNLVIGSPDDPDRIFSSEVVFALSHSSRSKIFKDYFDPGRLPNYVFRMSRSMIDNLIYGGIQTGGSKDDYRYKANWTATGGNWFFYKYADMKATGSIRNTMIPMLRIGEMYLIAAECQSDNLADCYPFVNLLRQKRGVGNLNTLDEKMLICEYIREMYGEGQLFFLYKRRFADIITSADGSTDIKASDKIFTVPLPDSETENRQ